MAKEGDFDLTHRRDDTMMADGMHYYDGEHSVDRQQSQAT
jgi:hypothetical protein